MKINSIITRINRYNKKSTLNAQFNKDINTSMLFTSLTGAEFMRNPPLDIPNFMLIFMFIIGSYAYMKSALESYKDLKKIEKRAKKIYNA